MSRARNKRASTAPSSAPPAPRGLSKAERATWRELAAAVLRSGQLDPADLPAFGVLVKAVAETNSPRARRMPATARVRLLQATAAMLERWGLTPAGRAKARREAWRSRFFEDRDGDDESEDQLQ